MSLNIRRSLVSDTRNNPGFHSNHQGVGKWEPSRQDEIKNLREGIQKGLGKQIIPNGFVLGRWGSRIL